ncbi:DUF3800 domain-containing protein [Microbacterium sp. NPDC058021]|uniref:DUF3800 domain-containing protein n=1 Tax=Microbacterium sp. NPDC058021 TaxID=3346306 RepID=UPI0036D9B26F
MLFAYIDESYIEGKVHLVGALVLDARQVDRIRLALDDVLWKTNRAHPEVPLTAEFHGQNLFQRSEEWSCLRNKQAVAFALYRRAIAQIANVGGAWFIGGVSRVDRLAKRYVDPWPPHEISLQYALELVDQYAAERGSRVTIIADQVPDQAHHEARVQQWQDVGRTPGWKALALDRIERPFDWVDSREHRPLQASDMLTYIYLRKRYGFASAHPRTVAEVERIRNLAIPCLKGQHVWTP